MVVGLLVAACSTDARGTRLSLQMAVGDPPPACPVGTAPPFRIQRDGNAMVFVDLRTEELASFVWPSGFAAWLEFGQAVLYASDGSIVGREGDVLANIGGTTDPEGFRVCAVGVRVYR
jgi:hypothetical protein